MDLFGDFFEEETSACTRKYTSIVTSPVYEPSSRCPHIFELYDSERVKRMIRRIEKSNLSKEEKEFLKEAAHRHTVFNYSKIADYYAHASKEMQELMEESALVIIDFDKAIELGFVKLQDGLKVEYQTSKNVRENEKN